MALGFEYADFGRGGRPYPFAVTGPLVMARRGTSRARDLVLGIVIALRDHRPPRRGDDATEAEVNAGTHTSSGFYVPAVMGTPASAAACSPRARPRRPADHLRDRPRLRLRRRQLPGPRGGLLAALAQRRHGRRAGGHRRAHGRAGFKATEMGIEGVQGFAAIFSGADARGRRAARRPRRLVGHHHPLGEALPDEPHAARAGGGPAQDRAGQRPPPRGHRRDRGAWQRVEPFLAKHKVSTVVSAQASLPFALSVAAVHRTIGVDQFTDETVADPACRASSRRRSSTRTRSSTRR